ncbi:hydroxymethylpyrimidine/phosphomethylpyrimidine kinase [Thiocapsa imhoffii]|uniref:hydroxymethylpyrimidine kinase n=1 Tax=Thiocapsa imhoffii TaxID=382777 RepID=A0A9X0WIV2_9GAMM|nr:hydroxymethylpyrimidine/phosphomethylpyrimidine kinase [Thiocapsa imhoffii]MBK1645552.1 hydroxymethylpyrimidine/phosphomethylpyrimidine kinase [Thiocapsa imhoffii]
MNSIVDRPIVLCIGGHDPSGGAGIIADSEAVRAAGAYPISVVSALTEQNTCELVRVHAQPAEQVESQCRTLLRECQPKAIKIGMAGSSRVMRVLNALIDEHPSLPVVLDPILGAGAGQQVVDAAMLNQLKTNLIGRSTLVTPNLIEARSLTDAHDLDDCAAALLASGARWVLITGTHDESSSVHNWLFNTSGLQQRLEWPRLQGSYHGSGCTLASAIAARLALGMTMLDAVAEAQAYTWESLTHALRTGSCQLTPNRLFAMDALVHDA